MSSIDKTVYEIKNVLLRGVFANNVHWQVLAKKFALEVAVINRKYNESLELIKNGKVIEAISLAEEGGISLLEDLDSINFPEQSQWYRVCCEREWKIPQQIDFSNLEVLINCYNSPLLNELFQHEYRKLSIKNGSIKRRITLLRHLLNIKNNEIYKKDLASLEKIYISELTEQIKRAIVSKDFVGMSDLLKKITDNRLVTVVDQRVTAKLNRELKKLHAIKIEKQLETLVQLINDAYSIFDIKLIGIYFQEWDILKNNENAVIKEQWIIQVEEARNWYQGELEKIAENEKQKKVLGELSIALKEQVDYPDLESLYLYLRSVNFLIPTNIEQLYQDAKDEYLANVRLKRLRKLLLSLMIIVITGTGVSFLFFQINEKMAINKEVKQINNILTEGSPEKAYNYVMEQQQVNDLYSASKIKKAVNNVISIKKAEKNRVVNLAVLYKELDLKLKDFHKKGLQESWNIETTINKISEITKYPEEKTVLNKVKLKYEKEKKIFEDNLIGKFNNILDSFSVALGKITPEFKEEAQERLFEADSLLKKAECLMYVPSEYSSKHIKLARQRLEFIRGIVVDYANRELILEEFKKLLLTNSYNLDSYLQELIRFNKKMKTISKGVDIVIANTPLYKNFNMFANKSQVNFNQIGDFELTKDFIKDNPWAKIIGNFRSYYSGVVKQHYAKAIKNISDWQKADAMKVYKISFLDRNKNIIPYYSLSKPQVITSITPSNVSYQIKAKLIDPAENKGLNVQFSGFNNNWILKLTRKTTNTHELPNSVKLASNNTNFRLAPYIPIWTKLSNELGALPTINSIPNFEMLKCFSKLATNVDINPVIKLQLLQCIAENSLDLMFSRGNESIKNIDDYLINILNNYQIPDRYIFTNTPLPNCSEIDYKLKNDNFINMYKLYAKNIINDSLEQMMSAIAINRNVKFIGCIIDAKKREKFLNLAGGKLNKCKELWIIVKDEKDPTTSKIVIIAKKNKFNKFIFTKNSNKILGLTPIFAPHDNTYTNNIENKLRKHFNVKNLPKYDFWAKEL